MKKFVISVFACLLPVLLYPQGRIAGVCAMYEEPVAERLTVPDGYEPWVISHYGRHGARYLTSANLYDSVYDVFAYENARNNLTEYGSQVYDRLLSIKKHFDSNAGALTGKGERQHRQIAKRMKRNYPSVFKSNPVITAVSSTSPRCIGSMEAFCSALGGNISMAADSSMLGILNPFGCLDGCDAERHSSKAAWKPYFRAYTEDLIDTAPFESRLFAGRYSCPEMSLQTFEARLFNVVQNLQCLDFKAPSFDGLFSEDEKSLLWERDNLNCFNQASAGFYGSDRLRSLSWRLLEDLILSADKDLCADTPSVRLRFGHDMTLNSLLSLMELEGWNRKAGTYSEIKEVFQNWKMPMAGNICMVIYRKKDAPALVRFFLHENAVSLPLEQVGDRLYRWSVFREHYLAVVAAAFRTLRKPACDYLFSIEPQYDGHAMQAFSINDGFVYAGYDSGLCRTYDFSTGRMISEFPLGCNIASNHCGNLNFLNGLLYVSGDLVNKACYVQRVTPHSAHTVQTIYFRLSNDYGGSQAVIDGERNRIVYIQRKYAEINRTDNEFMVSEFPVPDIDSEEVVYTDSDALRTYSLDKYFPIYQGASISDGRLYQSFGGPEDWRSSEGTGFAVFDVESGRLLKTVCVPFSCEPQSVLKYKGRMLMNFNGHGLYQVVNYDVGDMTLAAYVWPSCHDDALGHEWLWSDGEGEWEVIRKGTARFEGHYQPKEPLWGYEHDDDPAVVEKWIDTALKYGVNTFIYDWYWYKGRPFLESALDDGFLKAPSNGKMDFFVMWANHDVKYSYWNVHRYPENNDVMFSADFSREDYVKIVDRIVSKYFSRPNYLKINGRPVFAIYSYNNLVRSFGSVEKTAEALDYFRKKAREAGHDGIYLMDIRGEAGRLTPERLANTRMRIDSLGVDGIGFYNMGGFNTDYIRHGMRALELRRAWDTAFPADVYPCVSIAWDDTPRFPEKGADDVSRTNVSPDNFRIFLSRAKDYALRHPRQVPMFTVNAWNEWVEGSYLLPDRYMGFGYLEAVRQVVEDRRAGLNVMSFNIRNGKAADGENSWDNRKRDLAMSLDYEAPDIIGMQEVHDFQMEYILSECPQYAGTGVGRDDGRNGEQCSVLWKKSRFTLLDKGHFWLSETPDVPSVGWDAKYLRTAVWILLKDRDSGKSFYFVNTHLDNRGGLAKKKGLELIHNRMSSINVDGLPVVLTGDFNSQEYDETIAGFNDVMANAREKAVISDSSDSFNAWGDKEKAAVLDYIYYDGFDECEFFYTLKDGFNGRKYLSDHYPVKAVLKFTKTF